MTFHDPDELVRRRIRKGLNQQELAELAGIPRSTLCKAESGKYGDIAPRRLLRLAEILDCTVEDLERKPARRRAS